MNKEVDVRGKSCPIPVVWTKKALQELEENKSIITIVDNEVAKANVVKFADSLEYPVKVEQKGEEYFISITKESSQDTQGEDMDKQVIMLSSNLLGNGAEKLGDILMKSFVFSLTQSDELPAAIILMNSGVKLAVEGSDVLEHLETLEKNGVEIIVCGTCLDFYELKEKLCVGNVSNMYSILEVLMQAKRALTM